MAQMGRVQVGVGVVVVKDGRILLGLRRNAHGAGSWSLPGGHLEFNETPEACACREVREETGLDVETVGRGPFTDDRFPAENRHYITLFIVATHTSGTVQLREPLKCEEWRWCRWDELPSPLFTPLRNLLADSPDFLRDLSGFR